MMQQLRKNTKLILFIALAAFALLIFFQWGLDITGIKTQQKNEIAKIDGIPISYSDYLRFIQAKEGHREIDREQSWAEMVDAIMWNNLIRKEKIRVTDEEIWTIIKNNPPREVYESEYMKDEKGEFDFNKYLEFLKSPQNQQWLLQYEYTLREQLPKEKLRSLLSTMGWVSPYEDSLLITSQTTAYDISFISMPLLRARNLVEISDAEMREYYNKNIDEFINPESKILKYVFFERKPSPDDTLEAKERMEDFIVRIKEEGEDFLEVAREVSDDTLIENSFQNESDLLPDLSNIYKNLKDGEISDIIKTAFGVEVIKRVRKGLIYQAKANIQVSQTTLGDIHDRIISFKESAQEYGFDSTAVNFGLPLRKTYPLRKDNVNFPVRNVDALAKFLGHAKMDEIALLFSSLGGFYLFTLDSIIPQYQPKFEEIIPRIRAKMEKGKLKQAMAIYLDKINKQLRLGETMETVASKDSLVLFRNDLKGVGLAQIKSSYGDEFAGVVATLGPNQISPPLFTDWAGYVIRCDKKIDLPFDSTMVVLLQMKRQMRLQQLSMNLFTPQKIEDNRDEFFE